MLITVMIVLKVLEGTRGGNWDNAFQREGEESGCQESLAPTFLSAVTGCTVSQRPVDEKR